jgi:hypothetical protein
MAHPGVLEDSFPPNCNATKRDKSCSLQRIFFVGGPPFRVDVLHSCAKVQFDCIDQGHEPRKQRLMRRMLHISIEGSLVFELHDAAKRIALSSRRNVWAYMSLKKSRDYPLERGNLFRGPVFLGFGCSWLPLKCEHMKNAGGLAVRSREFQGIGREKSGSSDSETAISQQGTAC